MPTPSIFVIETLVKAKDPVTTTTRSAALRTMRPLPMRPALTLFPLLPVLSHDSRMRVSKNTA